jgi:hypothetical protein
MKHGTAIAKTTHSLNIAATIATRSIATKNAIISLSAVLADLKVRMA